MKNKPYKRKPGDLEIRILKNGKVLMMSPDENLIEVAQAIEPDHPVIGVKVERSNNDRTQTTKTN